MTNNRGSATSAGNFTVILPPTVTAITPATGSRATVIVLTGTNFTTATKVEFGSYSLELSTVAPTAGKYQIVSNTSIRVRPPSTAQLAALPPGNYAVRVTNPGGVASSPAFRLT